MELAGAEAALQDLIQERGVVSYDVAYLKPDGTVISQSGTEVPTEAAAIEIARTAANHYPGETYIVRRILTLERSRYTAPVYTDTDEQDE